MASVFPVIENQYWNAARKQNGCCPCSVRCGVNSVSYHYSNSLQLGLQLLWETKLCACERVSVDGAEEY